MKFLFLMVFLFSSLYSLNFSYVVKTNKISNVFNCPDISCQKKDVLQKNEIFISKRKKNNWFRIKNRFYSGWIKMEDVTIKRKFNKRFGINIEYRNNFKDKNIEYKINRLINNINLRIDKENKKIKLKEDKSEHNTKIIVHTDKSKDDKQFEYKIVEKDINYFFKNNKYEDFWKEFLKLSIFTQLLIVVLFLLTIISLYIIFEYFYKYITFI